MTVASCLAAAMILATPLAAIAYEPRFDHRDEEGPTVALEVWREGVAVSGQPTFSEVAPRLRLGWGFDLAGEGNELILGGAVRLGGWSDPEGMAYLYGLDARYRGYFGTEELKTFFDVGLWAEIQDRLAIGPEVGVGLAYDPSRAWGAFISLSFATGYGNARIASLGASIGLQFRFE